MLRQQLSFLLPLPFSSVSSSMRQHVLPEGLHYCLPTDAEWSHAVGLSAETGVSPRAKSNAGRNLHGAYPWGGSWPPPALSGNYLDEDAERKLGWPGIDGYSDGFITTSPVGSFPANNCGLFDMSGNVSEWCEDWDNEGSDGLRVLRGGNWTSYSFSSLLSTARLNRAP